MTCFITGIVILALFALAVATGKLFRQRGTMRCWRCGSWMEFQRVGRDDRGPYEIYRCPGCRAPYGRRIK